MNTNSLSARPRPRGAFTIVELLVVVAILLILGALIFMGMRSAKEQATAAMDANDMRAIASAVIMYAADNNDRLPTSSGGVGPVLMSNTRSLLRPLAPYFGSDEPKIGTYYKEFAAASWQSEANGTGPSLLVMHRVYNGKEATYNRARPSPNFQPFGYPYPPNNREGMTLTGAMAQMTDSTSSLMLTEVDSLHPSFRGSTPGWMELLPDGMAHGDFRLGVYWDGHVERLDVDLNRK